MFKYIKNVDKNKLYIKQLNKLKKTKKPKQLIIKNLNKIDN